MKMDLRRLCMMDRDGRKKGRHPRKSEVIQCLDRKNWKTFVERVRKCFENSITLS